MTATQTDPSLPQPVLSAMYLKFLADVDEYDNDEHRTVTASPDGPLVAMSEEALWFFDQWATLKYGAYPYISDWDTVAELVLHSPEPLVHPCGCCLPPGDPHPPEECWPAIEGLLDEPHRVQDNWLWRLYAKQQGPDALAAERRRQEQQMQEAFVALHVRFLQPSSERLAALSAAASPEAFERELQDLWPDLMAWSCTQDDPHGTLYVLLSQHCTRMALNPERRWATVTAVRAALACMDRDGGWK